MKKWIIKAIDCLYSLFFNLKLFPLKDAIKIPLYISHNTRVRGLYRGGVYIKGEITPRMISFGISEASFGLIGDKHSYIQLVPGAKLIFNGKAVFSKGSSIRAIKNGATIIVGKNAYFNQFCTLSSCKKIEIGDDFLAGWNVNIRDADGHYIYSNENSGNRINEDKEVIIGDHVWIASCSDILKGVQIPKDCIIAYKSCVTKSHCEENSIIAGVPARIVKRDIFWHI